MVRRRVAAGVALVILILIVLLISGCLKSEKTAAVKEYNHQVSTIAAESDSQVGRRLYQTLSGASGKSALDVEVAVDQLRIQMEDLANKAKGLSVPGSMTGAQRALLMAMNLRVEGITKLAGQLSAALGGQGKQTAPLIAGDNQILLGADTLFSQRVVPLIQQALSEEGVHELATTGSHFVPNIGWLEPNTVLARLSGQASGSSSQQTVTGNHGSALKGVSVGTNTLASEPTINHIAGGGSPTLTVQVENSGEFPETNVKVDATVTAGGKQYKASHVIEKTEPGKAVDVEIPLSGVPLGVAAKIEVAVEGVPGENDLENNKATYLAIFSQ
jgi:hypothetical protein